MPPEIPSRWTDHIRQYVLATTGEDRGNLRAYDFPPNRSVRLAFPDGSLALFRHAFYLRNDAATEVAVFTEHCGYHYFPAAELEVEALETVWESEQPDEDPPGTPAA